MNAQQFAYLDPSRGPAKPADPYTPRLRKAKAVTIGLMSNMFTDASAFLEDLKTPLGKAIEDATFKFYDKGELRNATFPAPAEMIERIVNECDGVVLAYGHCGSCTAGTVRDGVTLARAGLPVAVLVTTKFREEAAFIARAGGLPDTPFIFLPHPIAGREAAYHRAVAAAITGEIIAALREGRTSDCSRAAA
jgi:hypothetical protein